MGSLTGIREGLAAALSAGLRDCQVSAYVLANPTPPTVWVTLDPVEGVQYDKAMSRGWDSWTLVVQGFVPGTSDQGSQQRLDEWMESAGATSIKALLEADKTLGGESQDLRVTRCVNYGEKIREGMNATVMGADWYVEVIATGT